MLEQSEEQLQDLDEHYQIEDDSKEKKVYLEKFPFCATHFKNMSVKDKVKEFLESGIFTQEQFDKCNFLTRGEANQLFADKYHIGIDLALKEFKNKT